MGTSKSVTEYMLRAETSATRLKQAGEVVSDSLLIAMLLKGLPDTHRASITIITQTDSEKMDFQKFKSALQSYEESELSRIANIDSDNISIYSLTKSWKDHYIKHSKSNLKIH